MERSRSLWRRRARAEIGSSGPWAEGSFGRYLECGTRGFSPRGGARPCRSLDGSRQPHLRGLAELRPPSPGGSSCRTLGRRRRVVASSRGTASSNNPDGLTPHRARRRATEGPGSCAGPRRCASEPLLSPCSFQASCAPRVAFVRVPPLARSDPRAHCRRGPPNLCLVVSWALAPANPLGCEATVWQTVCPMLRFLLRHLRKSSRRCPDIEY